MFVVGFEKRKLLVEGLLLDSGGGEQGRADNEPTFLHWAPLGWRAGQQGKKVSTASSVCQCVSGGASALKFLLLSKCSLYAQGATFQACEMLAFWLDL